MNKTKHRDDRYGFRAEGLESAAKLVENLLGLSLTEAESSYYAGTYYRYRVRGGPELRLYRNYDDVTGEWADEDGKEYWALLTISDFDDMDGIRRTLTEGRDDLVFLYSEVFGFNQQGNPAETGE